MPHPSPGRTHPTDPVSAELVLAPMTISFQKGPKKMKEEMDEYRKKWSGKLRGKIVLTSAVRGTQPRRPTPSSVRYTDAQLADIAKVSGNNPAILLTAKKLENLDWPERPRRRSQQVLRGACRMTLMKQLYDLYDESVAERGAFFAKRGCLSPFCKRDERAHDGMLFGEAAAGFKSSALSRRLRSSLLQNSMIPSLARWRRRMT